MIVDGIPEVPQSIRQAIERYSSFSSNAFMGWSPTNGAMLINSEWGQTRQLHLLLSPQGERKMSTLFPDSINSGAFMPTLGDQIVFAADHGGDEFFQLYRLDPYTGRTQLLTDGDSRNGDVIYDHTGRQIAFLSTMPKATNEVIYAMNPRKHESLRILMTLDSGGWDLMDWAHDGCHILATHIRALNAGYLWSINTATGETDLLTRTRETQLAYVKAIYTPEDFGVYVIVLGPHDEQKIDYVALSNAGPIRKIPSGITHAVQMELSADGIWLAYLTDNQESQGLHIFNTLTGEELASPPLPPGFFARMRWNTDSTELGFTYGSTLVPFQAFSYKVATHELVQWTAMGGDSLPGAPIKPELVKVLSFDDLEISGYLYRPDPKKFPGKRPVIVSIHGGPAASFVPGFLGEANYYLNELGVALLYPNIRGSTGFGVEFTSLDDGYKREDAVKDIGAFLGWIATDPRLDSGRIGVQGASYGGYMTLAALYHYGNQVRCGSDLMGITDFVTFLRNTSPYRQANRRFEYGDERFPEMNKFLEGISPPESRRRDKRSRDDHRGQERSARAGERIGPNGESDSRTKRHRLVPAWRKRRPRFSPTIGRAISIGGGGLFFSNISVAGKEGDTPDACDCRARRLHLGPGRPGLIIGSLTPKRGSRKPRPKEKSG